MFFIDKKRPVGAELAVFTGERRTQVITDLFVFGVCGLLTHMCSIACLLK